MLTIYTSSDRSLKVGQMLHRTRKIFLILLVQNESLNFIKSYRIHVFKTTDHFNVIFVSDCKTAIPLNLLHRNNKIWTFTSVEKGRQSTC